MDSERDQLVRKALYAEANRLYRPGVKGLVCMVAIEHGGKFFGGLFRGGDLHFVTAAEETNMDAFNSLTEFAKRLPEASAVLAEPPLLTDSIRAWMQARLADGATLPDLFELACDLVEEVAHDLDPDGSLEDIHALVV